MFFNNLFLFVILFSLINNSFEWQGFWNGRRSGGNLGEPTKFINKFWNLPSNEWFEQKLDHFNPKNNEIWYQRYFTNNQYYEPGGPVFLMIGGEKKIGARWMVAGTWIKYAKIFNALCFQLEHRFYGKSLPTDDLSTENLKYLSSEQALADLAFFITAMNKKYNPSGKTKWIAFGGSYAGSLAAWLREKYPHLVHGAISSSAPILAKVDFYEYYNVVAESLATHSDNCVEAVKQSINQVEILLKNYNGQLDIHYKFKVCHSLSFSNPLDISTFFECLANYFAHVAQFNKRKAGADIDKVCGIMTDTRIADPVDRLAKVNSEMLECFGLKCLSHRYAYMVNSVQNPFRTAGVVVDGTRQWIYQTCTEFGFFITAENKSSIFGNRFGVEFMIQHCSDIFSKRFNNDYLKNAVQRTNKNYGGLHPKTTNVIFVHGSIDPWHALGLTSSNNPKLPAIYIKGTSHCEDMLYSNYNEPPECEQAREKIQQFISNLLHT